jgi:hypothetical protein
MLADQLDYVIGVDPHRDTHENPGVKNPGSGLALPHVRAKSVTKHPHALRVRIDTQLAHAALVPSSLACQRKT